MSAWFTSSYSNGSQTCVEVRFTGGAVLVRDTKFRHNPACDPAAQPTLRASDRAWSAFCADAAHGEFTAS